MGKGDGRDASWRWGPGGHGAHAGISRSSGGGEQWQVEIKWDANVMCEHVRAAGRT